MRAALIVASLAVVGCYRSHARPVPVDAPPPRDAPPTCIARCDAPVVLARIEGEIDESMFWPRLTVRGGMVVASFESNGSGDGYFVVTSVDAEDGRLLGRSEVPLRSGEPTGDRRWVTAPLLDGPLDGLQLTWVEILERDVSDHEVAIHRQALDVDGAPMGVPLDMGTVLEIRGRRRRRQLSMHVVGSASSSAVVWIEDGALWRQPLAETTLGVPSMVARFDAELPGFAESDVALLRGDRIAAIFRNAEERGDVYLAIERSGGDVLVETVVGERYDPMPEIVASGGGFALMRLVSNPRDVADAQLTAQVRDDDGNVVDAVTLRTTHGLTPAAVAGADVDGSPLFVWADSDGTLRVLPSRGAVSTWSACEGVAATPVLTESRWATSHEHLLTAVGAGDGSGDVLVMIARVSEEGYPAYDLLRVPGCRLDPAF